MCQEAAFSDDAAYDDRMHTVDDLIAALPRGVVMRDGSAAVPGDLCCTCWVDFPATAERNGMTVRPGDKWGHHVFEPRP